jgi:hypothetical protein
MRQLALLAILLLLPGCITREISHETTVTETVTITQTPAAQDASTGKAPAILFTEIDHGVTITNADAKADWKDVIVTFTQGCHARFDKDYDLQSGQPVSPLSSPVSPKQEIRLYCPSGQGFLAFQHIPTKTTYGAFSYDFSVPNVTFQQDQTAHTLNVVSADASASWANIKQTTTPNGGTCTVKFNGATTVPNGSPVASSSVGAGDFISLQHSSHGSCTITLTYIDHPLGTWTFNF